MVKYESQNNSFYRELCTAYGLQMTVNTGKKLPAL